MSVRALPKAKLMAFQSKEQAEGAQGKGAAELRAKFAKLVASSFEDQMEHFLTSFVLELGPEGLREVSSLTTKFQKAVRDINELRDMNHVQAAHFLQLNGKTRTALQRKQELADVDADADGRISLTEYLLLHYKPLILAAYFRRHGSAPSVDMSNECVGLTGVGPMLLEELFYIPEGMDPELRAAIDAFMAAKKAREAKVAELEAKAAQGGVKGLAAKNELAQLERRDSTAENRIEITLNAQRRRSSGGLSASEALRAQKEAEEKTREEQRRASRTALASKAALFERPTPAPASSA